MRYFARIGEREYAVDIEDDGVWLEGELVDVSLVKSGVDEMYSMLMGGRSHEMLIDSQRYDYLITLRGEQYAVQIEDERTRRLNASRKLDVPEGELAVKAPIPGLVVKVLVSEGETIREEQPLVLLEAMKMENELRAMRDGVIKQIKVAAGQRVEQNAVLIIME